MLSTPYFRAEDGHIYAQTYGMYHAMLAWNEELVAEAGMSEKDLPNTWEEYVRFAKELTRYDTDGNVTQAGWGTLTNYWQASWVWLDMMYQAGGHQYTEDVKKCLKTAKKTGVKLYTTKKIKDMPNAIPYPLDDIIKEFNSDYFGSGVDYAIAFAIYSGATEIHLWGILMILKFEYAHQKPSVEHWLGIAKGHGIKTVIHGKGSSILFSIPI